jgi:predicted ester cyclase
MPTQYNTLQHRWFDQVWNLGNECCIDEMLHPDVIGHGLTDENGEEIKGIEAFRAFYRQFRNAFPDIYIEIEQTIAEENMLMAICHCTATHTGEGFLVPPTGRKVDFMGSCTVRIENDQIVESWNHFDFLTVTVQLGLVSFPS